MQLNQIKRILLTILFISLFIFSEAQNPSWVFLDDIFVQDVAYLDDGTILFVGFWGAEIRNAQGELVESIEYPQTWIADCTSTFYDDGLIKHLDMVFSNVYESIDLEGNLGASRPAPSVSLSNCNLLHTAEMDEVDDNTLLIRDRDQIEGTGEIVFV